jgi:hypothetical protein
VLLGEMADRVGLTAALSEVCDGLRVRRSGHDPGRVLVDVAVAIADGAETISDVQALADQPGLHGPVASTATIWRVLDGVDADLLDELRLARAGARERAWTARGELTGTELPPARAAGRDLDYAVIDIDATLVTAHSEKEGAAGNFKGGSGFIRSAPGWTTPGRRWPRSCAQGTPAATPPPTTSLCWTWRWRSCPTRTVASRSSSGSTAPASPTP